MKYIGEGGESGRELNFQYHAHEACQQLPPHWILQVHGTVKIFRRIEGEKNISLGKKSRENGPGINHKIST